MKRKTVIHQFDPQIYPVKLWVSITSDLSAIGERFLEFPSGDAMGADETGKMRAFTQLVSQKEDRKIGVIVVFKLRKYCVIETIAHEATHATRMIWGHLGEYSTGMEADAYLVGWVADCIDKARRGVE